MRFLAATHRNLERLTVEGGFRQDLFYRLNVSDSCSTAAGRRADVILLAEHFLAQASHPRKRCLKGAQGVADILVPGNVRELKNVVERASVLARGSRIEASDLGFDAHESTAPEESTLPSALSSLKKR